MEMKNEKTKIEMRERREGRREEGKRKGKQSL